MHKSVSIYVHPSAAGTIEISYPFLEECTPDFTFTYTAPSDDDMRVVIDYLTRDDLHRLRKAIDEILSWTEERP